MKEHPEPFEFLPGASWLTEDGTVIPIPGFHEEWIASHPELAGEARNVSELVLAKRWISVALFGGGYVELLVPEKDSDMIRDRILALLSGARGRWSKALVMAMDQEGYAMLRPEDTASRESLGLALSRGLD